MEQRIKEEQPVIKRYTLSGLAKLYKVTRVTMRVWINKIKNKLGEKFGNYYQPEQVALIFETLGNPFEIVEEFAGRQKRKEKKYAKVHNVGRHITAIERGYSFGNF